MIQSFRRRRLQRLSLEEAASHWLVRLDNGPLSSQDQIAFDAWRQESEAHTDALNQAKNVWNLFDQAEGNSGFDRLCDETRGTVAPQARGQWFGVGIGVAASLLAFLGFSIAELPLSRPKAVQISAHAQPARIASSAAALDIGDFHTAKGERKTISLSDGSTITLNTDTAVHVAYDQEHRIMQLKRGQALFEVARNKAWPFIVQVGDRQVTALGTVFQVSIDIDRVKVILVQGKVVVDGLDQSYSKQSNTIIPTILNPGQELTASLGDSQILANVDTDQELRWRDGFVEFEDVPLSNAIAEMNRYSVQQLVIRDAHAANLHVSGIFRTGNPERFAAILSELLPLKSRISADGRIELTAESN